MGEAEGNRHSPENPVPSLLSSQKPSTWDLSTLQSTEAPPHTGTPSANTPLTLYPLSKILGSNPRLTQASQALRHPAVPPPSLHPSSSKPSTTAPLRPSAGDSVGFSFLAAPILFPKLLQGPPVVQSVRDNHSDTPAPGPFPGVAPAPASAFPAGGPRPPRLTCGSGGDPGIKGGKPDRRWPRGGRRHLGSPLPLSGLAPFQSGSFFSRNRTFPTSLHRTRVLRASQGRRSGSRTRSGPHHLSGMGESARLSPSEQLQQLSAKAPLSRQRAHSSRLPSAGRQRPGEPKGNSRRRKAGERESERPPPPPQHSLFIASSAAPLRVGGQGNPSTARARLLPTAPSVKPEG